MIAGSDPPPSTVTAPTNGIETSRPLPTRQVLRLACRHDPAQEYFVYIPGSGGEGAPVFVTVHGISRNVHEHAILFSECCEELGVVLVAPYFPELSKDYQRLGRLGRGPRADFALDAILDEIARMTGAATDRVYLHGFSGGAQFAHRYAMAHPHRIAGAVISAAGWYTYPDVKKRFPYGIRRTRDLPDVRFDPEEFLQVPMTVLVGEQDVTDVDLRCTKRVIRQQGVTRLDRARSWVGAMRDAARVYRLEPLVALETIPGGDHTFAALMLTSGLGARVFAALFGAPVERTPGGDDG